MFEAWKPFAIQGMRSTGNKSIKFIAKTHEIDVSAKGPIMLLFFGTKVSFTAPRTKSNAYSRVYRNSTDPASLYKLRVSLARVGSPEDVFHTLPEVGLQLCAMTRR